MDSFSIGPPPFDVGESARCGALSNVLQREIVALSDAGQVRRATRQAKGNQRSLSRAVGG
jgi:hypothetical protein